MSTDFGILYRLIRWKQTYELSFELAEIFFILLGKILDYCKENNIPIYNEEGMWTLIKKARAIFKEIEEINSKNFKPLKLPPFKFDDEDPDELPEPLKEKILKSGLSL